MGMLLCGCDRGATCIKVSAQARFRSMKNVTVLRIFLRNTRKIQVLTFFKGLSPEIFYTGSTQTAPSGHPQNIINSIHINHKILLLIHYKPVIDKGLLISEFL